MSDVVVSLLPTLSPIAPDTDLAVVIDVLRATSVMAVALANGAKSIVTCREIDEARQLSAGNPNALLCGERQCKPIDGFQLGNSPQEYDASVVAKRDLILTTTNGTQAIAACRSVPTVITASFLNVSAVIRQCGGVDRIHFVCAGTDGAITAEDVLLAGLLVSRLQNEFAVTPKGDDAVLARQFYRSWFADDFPVVNMLTQRLESTLGGRNLSGVGYQNDIEQCAAVDSVDIVPQRVSIEPPRFVIA